MVNADVVHALLETMPERERAIADADARKKGGVIGGWAMEIEVRLRVLKILQEHGVEIPNELEVIRGVKDQEAKLNVARREIVERQVATVVANLGVTPEDKKSARNRRQKQERDTRKANGDCVECPKARVRRAAPGGTRCDECGEKHRAQGVKYRERKKAQEGAVDPRPVEGSNASGTDSEPTTATPNMTDRATASSQTPSAGPSVEAPASAHQDGPPLSDTSAKLPFLTRIKQ